MKKKTHNSFNKTHTAVEYASSLSLSYPSPDISSNSIRVIGFPSTMTVLLGWSNLRNNKKSSFDDHVISFS